MKLIEHISFWGGIIGAIIVALNLPVSGWGYIPFLLSNAASIYLLRGSNASKVIERQCWIFVVINIVGIFRWLL